MKYICVQDEEGVEMMFTFSPELLIIDIAEILTRIRNQSYGNWTRVKRTPIAAGFIDRNGKCTREDDSAELPCRGEIDEALFKKQMAIKTKYVIVLAHGEEEREEIYTFPDKIHHDCFYESTNQMSNFREKVSAGFVDDGWICYGHSETLGIKSRKEDTEFLKKQFK